MSTFYYLVDEAGKRALFVAAFRSLWWLLDEADTDIVDEFTLGRAVGRAEYEMDLSRDEALPWAWRLCKWFRRSKGPVKIISEFEDRPWQGAAGWSVGDLLSEPNVLEDLAEVEDER